VKATAARRLEDAKAAEFFATHYLSRIPRSLILAVSETRRI